MRPKNLRMTDASLPAMKGWRRF
ncbi:hypothetical protein BRAS3809_6760006 [Bradyrhizobium sp. STM 3809]|nr:hypothetical protein BRAS3809_6760006 [Bradyrhizobium sp. STM 3809]